MSGTEGFIKCSQNIYSTWHREFFMNSSQNVYSTGHREHMHVGEYR